MADLVGLQAIVRDVAKAADHQRQQQRPRKHVGD